MKEATSYIELSESALRANFAFIRKITGSKTRLSSVVKGNAYGHGLQEYVPMAERCGVNHFSVFSDDEAYILKQVVQNDPDIMIMGHIDPTSLPWVIENEISFFCFTRERALEALKLAQRIGKKARMHLEVETGLNRTGLSHEHFIDLLQLIRQNQEDLTFEGICSHLAGAENIGNFVRIKNQRKRFKKFIDKSEEYELPTPCKHLACSAAIVRYPETKFDLARIGILQYGYWPSPEIFIEYCSKKAHKTSPLKRVISWKSTVMSVKYVKTGEYIGYGSSYIAHTDMKIATIPVGYAHGFSRSLSNQGRVLIRGERVPVIGTVNMNACTVDISELEGVESGEEVVLIGEQGKRDLSVASFAEYSSQLNYELLTRIPHNIPRIPAR